ncbi:MULTISPECIES: 50S ribosomal protein L23 [Eubacterium]|uniref:Large ribosomal subunit protein uL23 n=2 Tax=Eubacterium TaxID=1730 RepID=A0A1H4DSP0_9FIRM|nr:MULTISPECIES: 50S ribosomal protein L23 [Eubacterium]MDD4692718.1 50S ribosomal protein L23 [Eubacterium aggregans]MEA5074665.1 50S ribosomal protein L23 [Eubacterium aggregans]SDY34544.1 LSU ribosomal protein L23P [Eubacterium barkeri]SEA75751.1 LSU ribosomal protein L23P [Eubacterium aggregans]
MKDPRDIIIRPIISERTMDDSEQNKYTFEVAKTANKIEIKNAVEAIFDVTVEKVYTMNMNGKVKRRGRTEGRRPNWKKAIVKLTAGSKGIEFFEGV